MKRRALLSYAVSLVEQPTRLSLAVNLTTARRLGVALPAAVLARADRVIE